MPCPVVTSETAYDYLGRAVSVATPLGVTSNVYANGRLVRVTRSGSPDTRYVYDALGNVTATALDVDGDRQVTYAGTDRITGTDTVYEKADADWWRVTSSSVWNENGQNASLPVSTSRVRMTGLGVAAPAVRVLAHQGSARRGRRVKSPWLCGEHTCQLD